MQNLEMLLAMQDDDFQLILKSDEILDELQKQKFSIQDEYAELMYIFSGNTALKNVELGVFTLGLWCFLYSIRNSIVCGDQPTKQDIDVVLYLLHTGYDGVSENLYTDAKNFCEKNGISYESALIAIFEMIKISFRPLEMIPSYCGNDGEKTRFNLDWLTHIVSMVSKMVNCDREYILYKMPMVQAFYYMIQHLKENDIKREIRRRNTDEINGEIFKRTMDLGKIYYETKYKNK